jgi:hypothetical protein
MRLGCGRVDQGIAGEEDDSDERACTGRVSTSTRKLVVEAAVGAGFEVANRGEGRKVLRR